MDKEERIKKEDNKKINEEKEYHFIYFIVTHEKDKKYKIYLSNFYEFANSIEIIDKKNVFMKNCILVASIYRFKFLNSSSKNYSNEFYVFMEDENNNKENYIIKIKDSNKDYYEYNFKLENIGIIKLNYEQQFGMYVDLLRNKFEKKRDSKENEELILSSQLLLENDRYQYSFLFYFLVYSESLNTQQGYTHLLLFNDNKMRGIGEISEEKLSEFKKEINFLMDNPDKIEVKNTNYRQIMLELYFTLVYFFNFNFQKEKLKDMFENDKIKDFLYNNFANSKFMIKDLYLEIEYMNKIIEKSQNFNDILNLLYFLGNDCLQFLKFINYNKILILEEFIKYEIIMKKKNKDKEEIPLIEIDKYVKFKKEDDVSLIKDQIDILVKNEKNANKMFVKFSTLIIEKYKQFDEEENLNNLDNIKHIIDSIQSIDTSFELLSVNYIYFIENHEKQRNVLINLFSKKVEIKIMYSIEAYEEDIVFMISVYRIKIVKEIFEKTNKELRTFQFLIALDDEQNNRFTGLTEKINKGNDYYLFSFKFDPIKQFFRDIMPPRNCYLTYAQQFDLFMKAIKSKIKINEDEKIRLYRTLIVTAQKYISSLESYDFQLYMSVFVEAINIKDLLLEHLKLFEPDKLSDMTLSKDYLVEKIDNEKLINRLIIRSEILVDDLNIREKFLFYDRTSKLSLYFYNFCEKDKIYKIFDMNIINLHLYHALIKRFSVFKGIKLPIKYIKEMLKFTSNYQEMVFCISCNTDFLEVLKLIDEDKDRIKSRYNYEENVIEIDKIVEPKIDDNLDKIFQLILDLLLYEKNEQVNFLHFSPSVFEKYFELKAKISLSNCIQLNNIIFILREYNNDFKLNNNLNKEVLKKGLEFSKNKNFENLELLDFIKKNTYYKEYNYEKAIYRDINILNGMKIETIDDKFKEKWKDTNWILIFKSQEKLFFENICSLPKNLDQFNLLFELLYDDKKYEYYKSDILMNIQKKLLDQCNQNSNKQLNAHIALFTNIIIYLDANKLNVANFINELEKKTNKNFIVVILTILLANKREPLSPNLISIIEKYFAKNNDKIDLYIFSLLLQYGIRNDKILLFLNKNIIEEKDVYELREEESDKFKLLQILIIDKYIYDSKISRSDYFKKIFNSAKIMLPKIPRGQLSYKLIKQFYDSKKENILLNRIKLLTCLFGDQYSEKFLNYIKDNLLFCDIFILNLEKIQKYFENFLPNDKKNEIGKLSNDIDKMKAKTLKEIIDSKGEYKNYLLYLDEAKARNNYLNSIIFNSLLLQSKKENNKSDNGIIEIFEEKINDFKNIITKGEIKYLDKDILNEFSKLIKNREDKLSKELDTIFNIFQIDSSNKKKIMNDLSMILDKKLNILDVVNNLLYLIDFVGGENLELSKILKSIKKNLQKFNEVKIIELSEKLLNIYGVTESSYKSLVKLNEFNIKENRSSLNEEKYQQEDLNTINCFLGLLRQLNKINSIKDKLIIKIFLRFLLDLEGKQEIISLFNKIEQKINIETEETIQFFNNIYKEEEKYFNTVKFFLNKIEENKNDDFIKSLILLVNKDNFLSIYKVFKIFIQQTNVKKDKFFESINNSINAIENLKNTNITKFYLYILNTLNIKYDNSDNDYIKLFKKFEKIPESTEFLLTKSFEDIRIMINVFKSINDKYFSDYNILKIENCLKFMSIIKNNKEINDITDFDLIQNINIQFSKNINYISYFYNFFYYFDYINDFICNGFDIANIYLSKINNICKKSIFTFSNKKKNYFNGYYQIDIENQEDNQEKKPVINKIIYLEALKQLKKYIQINNDFDIYLEDKNKNKNYIKYISFIELISGLENIYLLFNNLYNNGYFNDIDIRIEVIDSNNTLTLTTSSNFIKEEKKMNVQEAVAFLNNILNELIISQKFAYKNNKIIRYIYGKQFNYIFKYLNKMSGYDNNDNNYINQIFKYITNSTAKQIIEDYIWVKGSDEYEDVTNNCINYFEKLLKINEISLDEIYEKNIIKSNIEYEKYRGLFSYSCNSLGKEIFQLYKYLTGNSPNVQNILFCNKETTNGEITAFLYRAILCDFHSCFIIGGIELLEPSTKNYLINLLNIILNEIKGIMNSCLIFININQNTDINAFLKTIKCKKFEKNIKKEIETQLINDSDIVEIVSSEKGGLGKSKKIKNNILNKKRNYIYFPLGGLLKREDIIKRLKKLPLRKESSIHLDLFDTENIDIMEEFLFWFIIVKLYKVNEDIFYLLNDTEIHIEIPNFNINFFSTLKILTLIPPKKQYKISINNLDPLFAPQNIKSNIQIVCNYLKLLNDDKIDDNDIYILKMTRAMLLRSKTEIKVGNEFKSVEKSVLEAKILSQEECDKLIFKIIKGKNMTYYQIKLFIDVLGSKLKEFNKNFFLNAFYLSQGKNNLNKVRKIIVNNLIKQTEYFIKKIPNDKINKKDNVKLSLNINNINNDNNFISFDKLNQTLFYVHEGFQDLFTIITNKAPEDEEYKKFLQLQNFIKVKILKSYHNYKLYKHEDFLKEIKDIFALQNPILIKDKKNQKELSLQEIVGNYVITPDNFIKMLLILTRIRANIPIILMGETGCGKTSLLKKLFDIMINKSTFKMKILNFNEEILDEDIVNIINNIKNDAKKLEEEEEKKKEKYELRGIFYNKNKIWVFLDQINRCKSTALITELICKHSLFGIKLPESIEFIAACNPYRFKEKKSEDIGDKELAYNVNPFPNALYNFVLNFGYISKEDEKKYIEFMIINTIEKIYSSPDGEKLADEQLTKIKDLSKNLIIEAQNFIKDKFEISSVSLRDIARCNKLYKFFHKYLKIRVKLCNTINEESPIVSYDNFTELDFHINAINLSVFICYYLRIPDKNIRKQLVESLNKIIPNEDFLKIPTVEENFIFNNLEVPKGTVKSKELLENCFALFCAINSKTPIFIIDKSDNDKSLCFELIYKSMVCSWSTNPLFKILPKIILYSFNEYSNHKDIGRIFSTVSEKNKSLDKDNKNIYLPVIFYDEINISTNTNKKKIYSVLEDKIKDSNKYMVFVGISNMNIADFKINKCICVSNPPSDENDFINDALNIVESIDKKIFEKYKVFFENLAKTYYQYKITYENKINIHGKKDFIDLIKYASLKLLSKDELIKGEKDIFLIGIESIERKLAGFQLSNEINSVEILKKIFCQFYPNFNCENNYDFLKIIKESINDFDNRNLLLFSNFSESHYLLSSILKDSNYKIVIGSQFKEDYKNEEYHMKIINKIKFYINQGGIIILKDFDCLFPSLYELFSKNFKLMNHQNFVSISNGSIINIFTKVHEKLKCIVNVEIDKINKQKESFVNVFEKHIISYKNLLSEELIEESIKIKKVLNELISFSHNNEIINYDLNNLLINCGLEQIQGIIYHENLKGIKKEELMNNVLSKIAPILPLDIIIPLKFNNDFILKEKIIDYYISYDHSNLLNFLKNTNNPKNVVYTFSKDLTLIDDLNNIQNETLKFGINRKEKIKIIKISELNTEMELENKINELFKSDIFKMCIIHFIPGYYNFINYTKFIVENKEKEFNKIKIFIFIVHIERTFKNELKDSKENNNKNLKETISNLSNFCQIFIDNLNGKYSISINKIIKLKKEEIFEFILKQGFEKIMDNSLLINNDNNNSFHLMNLNKNNHELLLFIKDNEEIKELIFDYLKKKLNNMINKLFNIKKVKNNEDELEKEFATEKDIDMITIIKNYFINHKQFHDFIFKFENSFMSSLIAYKKEIKENVLKQIMIIFLEEFLKKNGDYNIMDNTIKFVSENITRNFRNDWISLKDSDISNNSIEFDDFWIKLREYCNLTNSQLDKEEFILKINNIIQKNEELNKKIYDLLIDDYCTSFIKKEINEQFESKSNKSKRQTNVKSIKKLFLFMVQLNNDKYKKREKISLEEKLKLVSNTINWADCYKNEIRGILTIYSILDTKIKLSNLDEKIKSIFNNNIKDDKINLILQDSYNNNEIFLYIIEYLIKILLNNKEIFFDCENLLDNINHCKEIIHFSNMLNSNKNLFSKILLSFEEFIEILNIFYINKISNKENTNKLLNLINFEIDNDENSKLQNYLDELIQFLIDNLGVNNNFSKIINLILSNEYKKNKINHEFILEKILQKEEFILNCSNIINSIIDESNLIDISPKKIENNLKNISENDETIIKELNNCNKPFLDEILLNYYELNLNLYFENIPSLNNNILNEYFKIYVKSKRKPNLVFDQPLELFRQSISYFNENHINENNYNLCKLYSISYIKLYLSYLIYYEKEEKQSIGDIKVIIDKLDSLNKNFKKVIKIYIFKLFLSLMANYSEFEHFDFENSQINFHNDFESWNYENRNEMLIFYFLPLDSEDKYLNYLDIYNIFEEQRKNKFIDNPNLNNSLRYIELDLLIIITINKIISNVGFKNYEDKNKEEFLNFFNFSKLYITQKSLYNENLNNLLLIYYNKEKFESYLKPKLIRNESFDSHLHIILLYGFRLCVQTLYNNNNLYADLVKENALSTLQKNFIPGNYNSEDLHLDTLSEIENHFNYYPTDRGCYVCSCGYYYSFDYKNLSLNNEKLICPKCEREIGYENKGDEYFLIPREGHYRIFKDEKERENEINNYKLTNEILPNKTYKEYIKDIIGPILNKEKPGLNNIDKNLFMNSDKRVRNLSKIGLRLLNFILHIHLFYSNCLGYISEEDLKKYCLIEDLTSLEIIEQNWFLLEEALREKSIQFIEIFMNLIFTKLSKLLKNCEYLQTIEERNNFEDKIENIIKESLNEYDSYKVQYIKKNYKQAQLDKNNIKIIINELVPVEEYSEKEYPFFKYFMTTKYQNKNSFLSQIEKINLKTFKSKYPLISQLLADNDNIKKLKYLPDINEFSNFIIDYYSNKITREEAKNKILDEKLLKKIENKFNKFKSAVKEIKGDVSFYKSLKKIKYKELEKETPLIYFFNDDSELDYGIYITAAYQKFISWQNEFLQSIIPSIDEDSKLYFYLNNLKKKIFAQDAIEENILSLENINLENIIRKYSRRDIFKEDGTINYINYNSFVYDFDSIEKELAKLILPGKCLFKKDGLRFISYNFDINSEITIFNINYSQSNLNEKEKNKVYYYYKTNLKEKDINAYKNFFNSFLYLFFYLNRNKNDRNKKIIKILEDLPEDNKISKDFINFINKEGKELEICQLIKVFLILEDLSFDKCINSLDNKFKSNFNKTVIENKNKIFEKKENLIKAIQKYMLRYLILNDNAEEIDKRSLISELFKSNLWNINENEIKDIEQIINEEFGNLKLTISNVFYFYQLITTITSDDDDNKSITRPRFRI